MLNSSSKHNTPQPTVSNSIRQTVDVMRVKLRNSYEALSSAISSNTATREMSEGIISTRQADLLRTKVHVTPTSTTIDTIGGIPLYFALKRTVDVLLASLLLVLMMPVLIMIAVYLKVDGGSIFSKQTYMTSRRIKQNKKTVWEITPFTAYQFHITNSGFGQFLASMSLNELPIIFNILRGDISFVGSHMIDPNDCETLKDWQLLSFACKPGIIGLSRISGKRRWLVGDDTRQEIWYACHQSLALDAKILAKTTMTVIAG